MEDHKIHTRSSVSGKDHNYNMRDLSQAKNLIHFFLINDMVNLQ